MITGPFVVSCGLASDLFCFIKVFVIMMFHWCGRGPLCRTKCIWERQAATHSVLMTYSWLSCWNDCVYVCVCRRGQQFYDIDSLFMFHCLFIWTSCVCACFLVVYVTVLVFVPRLQCHRLTLTYFSFSTKFMKRCLLGQFLGKHKVFCLMLALQLHLDENRCNPSCIIAVILSSRFIAFA